MSVPRRLRNVVVVAVLGVAPAVLLATYVGVTAVSQSTLPAPHSETGAPRAIDFHSAWIAGRAYLHGHSPYLSNLGAFVGDGPHQSFVYPPATAAFGAPFALLPYAAAKGLFVVAAALALGLALWILGVRDWRCYGAAFASPAVLTSISVGTLTPLMVLAAASAWRLRHMRFGAGVAVGLGVTLKLFLWPLVLWLWLTGRRAAALAAVVIAVVANALAWAVIGFDGFAKYPSLLRHLTNVEGVRGYGLPALFGSHVGMALLSILAVVLIASTVLARRVDLDEDRLFAAGVVASILLSPVVWLHYLALLVVVLAVRSPRLNVIWWLPPVLWVTYRATDQGAGHAAWRLALVLFVIGATAFGGRDRTAHAELRCASSSAA
jgi:Glycosyltransferase family 87